MPNRDEIDEIVEAALAAYSRIEPPPERIAAWLEAASSRRRHPRPSWPAWIAVAAAAAAALLILAPRLAERAPVAEPTVTTAAARVASVPSPAPPIRRKQERPAVSAAPPGAARAWAPFPLPRPMTAEEAYALALLQSQPTADSAPPDLSQEIKIPEISIPPIAPTPDSIAITNKDGNQ